MESKLNLNMDLVAKARASAAKVADDVQAFIDEHTTVTVERAVCRLLGIDGVNELDAPLPNIVVDHLLEKGILPGGAAFYIGNAMAEYGYTPSRWRRRSAPGNWIFPRCRFIPLRKFVPPLCPWSMPPWSALAVMWVSAMLS